MKKLLILLFAWIATGHVLYAGPFADSVVSYNPGTGFAAGFTNANSALGSPSQINPFGDAVDPFNAPYGNTQLVSLGAGGSLTLLFNTPILNNPSNPYGLDFLVFGNSGFVVTNATDTNFNFIGTPSTDGTLYGNNPGVTQVSVSPDGINFFALNPALAPVVDGYFPTDGAGDFGIAVNPSLTRTNFAGRDLTGIRSAYAGSGGGTGFDISWATDTNGGAVALSSISYVRVDVLSGKSEIDALGTVTAVPEPGLTALLTLGFAFLFFRRSRTS